MEAAKPAAPASCPVKHGAAWLGANASDGGAAAASACPIRGDSGGAAVGVDPGNMMRAGGERNLPAAMQRMPLDTSRQVSTIPKSDYNPDHQDDTKQLWEYPSPQMFFNAMRRKGYQPSEHDMNMVVAIHNAVNERAWSEVLAWENMHKSSCGQPKLLKFEGRPKDLTPRARLKSWMGYALPFDRHDWTVDRCAANRVSRIHAPRALIVRVLIGLAQVWAAGAIRNRLLQCSWGRSNRGHRHAPGCASSIGQRRCCCGSRAHAVPAVAGLEPGRDECASNSGSQPGRNTFASFVPKTLC
jgi:hypothetical protein